MNANELLVYTDMDGTALSDWDRGPVLPRRNLDAIYEFTEAGGIFSVASGRVASNILQFFPGVSFKAPLVCGNGAILYDVPAERVLRRVSLPSAYKEECAAYVRARRNLWLVAADSQDIYQVTFGIPEKDRPIGDRERPFLPAKEWLSDERFIKVIYVLPPGGAEMEQIKKETASFASAGLVASYQSSPRYLEIVEKSVSKGEGVRFARRAAGLEGRTLVCIGDYFNDLSMLRLADLAACPQNAAPGLMARCRIVTCDNNRGALADLFDQLKRL